jgi:hypothetical protein
MRDSRRLVVAILAAALLAAAPLRAGDDVVVRSEAATFPLQGARLLEVEVPVGEIDVVAVDGDRIEARLAVICDEDSRRCRQQAARVRLRPERRGADLSIDVVGYPRTKGGRTPKAELELRVPRALALSLEVGVGEVDVRGSEGDLDVELGVGEVRVRVPERVVEEVSVDVGVGEANLHPRPSGTRSSRFLFLGNEIDWDGGSGRSRITVEVGVGEADVGLEL